MKPEIIQSDLTFVFNGKARVFANISVKVRNKDKTRIGPILTLVKSDHMGILNKLEWLAVPLTSELIQGLRKLVASEELGSNVKIELTPSLRILRIHRTNSVLIENGGKRFVVSSDINNDSSEMLKLFEFLQQVLDETKKDIFVVGQSFATQSKCFNLSPGEDIIVFSKGRQFRYDRLTYLITEPNLTNEGQNGLRGTLVTGASKFTLSLLNKTHDCHEITQNRFDAFLSRLKICLLDFDVSGVKYISQDLPVQFISWERVERVGTITPTIWLTLFDHTRDQSLLTWITKTELGLLIDKLELLKSHMGNKQNLSSL